MRPRAILSQLLLVLALALFGVPQSPADGTLPHAGPVAQSKVEQAQGNLSVQRHLLRGQLPDEDLPDTTVPGAADQTRQLFVAAGCRLRGTCHISL
ncbi:hypothetical protein [Pelagibacterium lentulum]|uniref:hypothetical protein n=1 Tax=Pelagibacterium lentulum TaxID=2029865 RepID=UPI000F8CE70D|nr:hypothetical protein [Pelagibacterium lentulum]